MARNLNITELPVADEPGIKVLGVTPDKDIVHVDLDAATKARIEEMMKTAAPLKIETPKEVQEYITRTDKVEKDLRKAKLELVTLKKQLEALVAQAAEKEKEVEANATILEQEKPVDKA